MSVKEFFRNVVWVLGLAAILLLAASAWGTIQETRAIEARIQRIRGRAEYCLSVLGPDPRVSAFDRCMDPAYEEGRDLE